MDYEQFSTLLVDALKRGLKMSITSTYASEGNYTETLHWIHLTIRLEYQGEVVTETEHVIEFSMTT